MKPSHLLIHFFINIRPWSLVAAFFLLSCGSEEAQHSRSADSDMPIDAATPAQGEDLAADATDDEAGALALIAANGSLQNPGFENSNAEWAGLGRTDAKAIDKYQHYAGAYSAKLLANSGAISQRINIKASTSYTVATYIKTSSVSGAGGAYFRVSFYDAKANLINATNSVVKTGSVAWQKLSLNVTSPSNAGSILISLRNYATSGTAWYDVVSLDGGSSSVTTTQASPSTGPTFYMAPNGSDSNPGTSDKPWKTFAKAIAQLDPGEVLVLKDGTYTKDTSGLARITCGTNAKSGMQSAPITIRAQNERKAFLKGDGSNHTFVIENCSWWNVEGLRGESADNLYSATGYVFRFLNSHNLKIRRLLGARPNRNGNNHVINVGGGSSYILVEESEAYYFHRHGIPCADASFVTYRRNYANSRNYSDLGASAYRSRTFDNGDEGMAFYDCGDSLNENSISEGNDYGFPVHADGNFGKRNKLLGLIALNQTRHGVILNSRGNSEAFANRDNLVENFVSVNSAQTGIYTRSAINAQIRNVSLLGGGEGGLLADLFRDYQSSLASFFCTNCLVAQNAKRGFYVINQANWGVAYSNAYGNGNANYSPKDSHVTGSKEVDPKLGSCKVYIPASTPMNGAGKNGADIGANVIYRYENGVLTTKKLWNQTTGQFPCGATVAGVNDIAGASCFDVHKRLNVGVNGCAVP